MHHIRPGSREEQEGVAAIRRPILHCVIAVSLMMVGTLLLVRGALPVFIHWPYAYTEPVRAQVIESRFEDVPGWQGVFRSRPIFNYRYVHGGELFLSSAYRPAGKHSEAVRRFVPGLAINAFVDPDHPTRAMVQPGLTPDDLAIPALGLITLLSGLAFLGRIRF